LSLKSQLQIDQGVGPGLATSTDQDGKYTPMNWVYNGLVVPINVTDSQRRPNNGVIPNNTVITLTTGGVVIPSTAEFAIITIWGDDINYLDDPSGQNPTTSAASPERGIPVFAQNNPGTEIIVAIADSTGAPALGQWRAICRDPTGGPANFCVAYYRKP